jgi:hypothetical protein
VGAEGSAAFETSRGEKEIQIHCIRRLRAPLQESIQDERMKRDGKTTRFSSSRIDSVHKISEH